MLTDVSAGGCVDSAMFGDVRMPIFCQVAMPFLVAGAIFANGEIVVSLFAGGAILRKVVVSFFVAGAIFGDVRMPFFLVGAIFGEVVASFSQAGAIITISRQLDQQSRVGRGPHQCKRKSGGDCCRSQGGSGFCFFFDPILFFLILLFFIFDPILFPNA